MSVALFCVPATLYCNVVGSLGHIQRFSDIKHVYRYSQLFADRVEVFHVGCKFYIAAWRGVLCRTITVPTSYSRVDEVVQRW